MDELTLLPPSETYFDQIRQFRQEFLDNADSLDGTTSLEKYPNPADWLAWLGQLADAKTCPKAYVTSTQYLCVRRSDDRLVGMVSIRHTLNDRLAHFGGHIGYCIRKSERRRGYAREQLRLALLECRGLGLYRVLLCCADTNAPSRRVIVGAGGVFDGAELDPMDGALTQRYWLQVCKPGLLVEFPGAGYTCAAPLMLGCSDIFRLRQYETIPLDFSGIPFAALGGVREALEAAKPVINDKLAGIRFEEYADVVFLSKSFGAVCAGWAAAAWSVFPRQLYLTPLPEALPYIRPGESVISAVLGDRDAYMEPERLRGWCDARGIPLLLLEGAGHRLELPDDEKATAALHEKIFALCRK